MEYTVYEIKLMQVFYNLCVNAIKIIELSPYNCIFLETMELVS